MSASIRFLGFAVFAWAGVRAASLGLIPGTEAFAPAAEAATTAPLPPVAQSQFPAPAPASPPAAAGSPYAPYGAYPGYGAYPPYPQPVAVPYYYPVPAVVRRRPSRRIAAWV